MSYRILPKPETPTDRTTTSVTLHYERDRAQESCVFVAPTGARIHEDPEKFLTGFLEQGKKPDRPDHVQR